MKKWFLRIALLVTLLGSVAVGYALWLRTEAQEHEEVLTLYGNIEIREIELAFEVRGRVKEVLVEEGERVEQNQLLAVLDPVPFELELERAEAQLESQRQVVSQLEAGTRPQEIRRVRTRVNAAQARLVEARRSYERAERLAATEAITEQELDRAREKYQTARAELEAAQAELDLALAGPREQEIAAAKAKLNLFKAEKKLAERSLEDARLHAPSEATLRNRLLEPGDLASPDKPAFIFARTDPVWVRAYLPEPDLGKIRPGMQARVMTDSFPNKTYPAWVGFISPTAEFTPKTVQTEELRTRLVYEVRVMVRNPQGELRLGMPATVQIPLRRSQDDSQ